MGGRPPPAGDEDEAADGGARGAEGPAGPPPHAEPPPAHRATARDRQTGGPAAGAEVLHWRAVRLYPRTARQRRRAPFQSGEGCHGSGGTRASGDNSCYGDRVGGGDTRASGVSGCSVG